MVEQILFLDPVALPVWLVGILVFRYAVREALRFFAWTYLIVMAVFMVLNGKTYYVLPFYPIRVAAGGVASSEGFGAVAPSVSGCVSAR